MTIKGHKQAGFTLLEVIIALIIMAGLASIALPNFMTTVERMRAKEGDQILLSLLAAQKRYSLDHAGAYADDLADLDVEVRPSAYFGTPTVADVSPLASIVRTGSYTLEVSDTGTINCSGGSGNICSKMGY